MLRPRRVVISALQQNLILPRRPLFGPVSWSFLCQTTSRRPWCSQTGTTTCVLLPSSNKSSPTPTSRIFRDPLFGDSEGRTNRYSFGAFFFASEVVQTYLHQRSPPQMICAHTHPSHQDHHSHSLLGLELRLVTSRVMSLRLCFGLQLNILMNSISQHVDSTTTLRNVRGRQEVDG